MFTFLCWRTPSEDVLIGPAPPGPALAQALLRQPTVPYAPMDFITVGNGRLIYILGAIFDRSARN